MGVQRHRQPGVDLAPPGMAGGRVPALLDHRQSLFFRPKQGAAPVDRVGALVGFTVQRAVKGRFFVMIAHFENEKGLFFAIPFDWFTLSP